MSKFYLSSMFLFLTLALVLVLTHRGIADGGKVYCVQPSEPWRNGSATDLARQLALQCADSGENRTWNDLVIQSRNTSFPSDATFVFLPGVHYMNESLSLADRGNLRFVGSGPINTVVKGPPGHPIAVQLSNLTNIDISGLHWSLCMRCPTVVVSRNQRIIKALFSFWGISNLVISHCTVQNTCGGQEIFASDITNFTLRHTIIPTLADLTADLDLIQLSRTCTSVQIEEPVATVLIDNSHFSADPNDRFQHLLYIQKKSTSSLDVTLNSSMVDCGGIYMEQPGFDFITSNVQLVIDNTMLKGCRNNHQEGRIGLFLSQFGSSVRINNSVISDFSSGMFSLFTARVIIVVENSQFSRNIIETTEQARPVESFVGNNNYALNTGMSVISVTKFDDAILMEAEFKNVTFSENQYRLAFIEGSYFPQLMLFSGRINLVNCNFLDGRGSALYLDHSRVNFTGNNTFGNNTSFNGGAIYITGVDNALQLTDETRLVFDSNNAENTGGAIYLGGCFDSTTINPPTCFISKASETSRMLFSNNRAILGGDAIYGGDLDKLPVVEEYVHVKYGARTSSKFSGEYTHCITLVKKISRFSSETLPSNLSLISSAASRICVCNDSLPQCSAIYTSVSTYPGQKFGLPLVLVGQNFGTITGSVYAQLLAPNESLSGTSIGQFREVQNVGQYECTEMHYHVFSRRKNAVLVLTANPAKVFDYPNPSTVNSSIEEYIQNNFSYVPKNLLNFALYINISFKTCPPGFDLTEGENPKCGCNRALQRLEGSSRCECLIDTQEVERQGRVWISVLTGSGDNTTEVIYSEHCPYNYCYKKPTRVDIQKPAEQCQFNRSGILCGKCAGNLSLSLGGSQCRKCDDNAYSSLIIVFAIAGIVLVIFIKFVDLTVAVGLINGLTFYANIMKCNSYLSFESDNQYIQFLKVFLSWVNLDVGIEMCFYHGLDSYTKMWLQFVFPIYLWVIVFVMILLARYSVRISRLFGNNPVPVLATLFNLSYAKMIRTTALTLNYTILIYPNGQKYVWSSDGNIDFLELKHLFLFLVTLFIVIFLWIPYTLILLLGQWLQKYSIFNRLKPIFDAHYGPFNDKHRYWFGVLLLARTTPLILSVLPDENSFIVYLAAIFVTGTLITYQASLEMRLYRKWYVSVSEALLLLNIILVSASGLYVSATRGNMDIFIGPLTTFAFLQFVAIVIFSIFKQMKGRKVSKYCASYMRVRLLQCVASKVDICNNNDEYLNVDLQISHRQSFDGEF